MNDNPVRF